MQVRNKTQDIKMKSSNKKPNTLMGEVNIDNRILTDDTVTILGNDKYKVTHRNNFYSNAESAVVDDWALVTVDGKLYAGKEIIIDKEQVFKIPDIDSVSDFSSLLVFLTDAGILKKYFITPRVDREIVNAFYFTSDCREEVDINPTSLITLKDTWLYWYKNDHHLFLLQNTLVKLNELILSRKMTKLEGQTLFLNLYKKLNTPEFFLSLMLPNLTSDMHLKWFKNLNALMLKVYPQDNEIKKMSESFNQWKACEDFINDNDIKNPQGGFYWGNKVTSNMDGYKALLGPQAYLKLIRETKQEFIEKSIKNQGIFDKKSNIDSETKKYLVDIFNQYYQIKWLDDKSYITGKSELSEKMIDLYYNLLDDVSLALKPYEIKNVSDLKKPSFWSEKTEPFALKDLEELRESLTENVTDLLKSGYQFNIEYLSGSLYPNNAMIKIHAIPGNDNQKKRSLGYCVRDLEYYFPKDSIVSHDRDAGTIRFSAESNKMKVLHNLLIELCGNKNVLNEDAAVKYSCTMQ